MPDGDGGAIVAEMPGFMLENHRAKSTTHRVVEQTSAKSFSYSRHASHRRAHENHPCSSCILPKSLLCGVCPALDGAHEWRRALAAAFDATARTPPCARASLVSVACRDVNARARESDGAR